MKQFDLNSAEYTEYKQYEELKTIAEGIVHLGNSFLFCLLCPVALFAGGFLGIIRINVNFLFGLTTVLWGLAFIVYFLMLAATKNIKKKSLELFGTEDYKSVLGFLKGNGNQ